MHISRESWGTTPRGLCLEWKCSRKQRNADAQPSNIPAPFSRQHGRRAPRSAEPSSCVSEKHTLASRSSIAGRLAWRPWPWPWQQQRRPWRRTVGGRSQVRMEGSEGQVFLLRRRARAAGGGQCARRREHHSRDGVGESRSSVGGENGHNPGQGIKRANAMDELCRETVLGLTKKAGEVGDGQGRPSDATGQSLESRAYRDAKIGDALCVERDVGWGPVDECVPGAFCPFSLAFLRRGRLFRTPVPVQNSCAGLSGLGPPTRGPYDAMNKRSTKTEWLERPIVRPEACIPQITRAASARVGHFVRLRGRCQIRPSQDQA